MATGNYQSLSRSNSEKCSAAAHGHTWSRSFSDRMRGWGFGPLQEKLRAVRKKKVQGEFLWNIHEQSTADFSVCLYSSR